MRKVRLYDLKGWCWQTVIARHSCDEGFLGPRFGRVAGNGRLNMTIEPSCEIQVMYSSMEVVAFVGGEPYVGVRQCGRKKRQ